MANIKKIVGIILLVSGLISITYFGYALNIEGIHYIGWFLGQLIIGVVLFVIGLVLLILSRKKNGHIILNSDRS